VDNFFLLASFLFIHSGALPREKAHITKKIADTFHDKLSPSSSHTHHVAKVNAMMMMTGFFSIVL